MKFVLTLVKNANRNKERAHQGQCELTIDENNNNNNNNNNKIKQQQKERRKSKSKGFSWVKLSFSVLLATLETSRGLGTGISKFFDWKEKKTSVLHERASKNGHLSNFELAQLNRSWTLRKLWKLETSYVQGNLLKLLSLKVWPFQKVTCNQRTKY